MEASTNRERPTPFVCTFFLSSSMFAGVFGVFFSILKNMQYAILSFLFLEITCVILLSMYSLHMKGKLFTKFTRPRLKCILVLACIILVSTLAFAIFLLVSAIRKDEDTEFTMKKDRELLIAFVPCLISSLWSGLLIYETRRFIGLFDQQHSEFESAIPYKLTA